MIPSHFKHCLSSLMWVSCGFPQAMQHVVYWLIGSVPVLSAGSCQPALAHAKDHQMGGLQSMDKMLPCFQPNFCWITDFLLL